MIQKINSEKRGLTKTDWLNSRHSFSFGDFYDESMMHFGPLRVLNDDYVAPGGGFPTHPHKDMEIITYVIEGTLRHRDSMGVSELISANQIQKMSAGSGVYHSEFNASGTESVHFFQTWILPSKKALKPSYQMKTISRESKTNRLLKIASPNGEEESIAVVQDVGMFAGLLEKGKEITHPIADGRGVYLHVVSGRISVPGIEAGRGDAVTAVAEKSLAITALEEAEIILFDVLLDFSH